MNDIYTRQNDEEILMLQYSQRKHYELAERLQFFLWITTIINIIIVNNETLKTSLGNNTIAVIGAIYMILYTFVKLRIKNNIKFGAFTKELIDCKLYKFDVSKRLIDSKFTVEIIKEKAVLKRNRHIKDYMVQIHNTGEDNPPGVKNWYEDRRDKEMNSAIYGCQCENLWWDERLSNKYIFIFVSISIMVLGGLIIANKDVKVMEFIFTIIIPGLPIILELYTHLCSYIKIAIIYRTKMEMVCREIVKDLDTIKIERLVELQDIIFTRRLNEFLIPTKLHRIVAKKYHELRQVL